MRKYNLSLMAVLCAAALSFQLHATTSEKAEPISAIKVNWINPEKFSDIRPATGTRKSYQERVIKGLDNIWADLATKLPPGYSMEISIKDVDLAGDVNPMYRVNNTEIRVIKDIYFPRMTLDYVLLDANKQPVKQETDVKIKDMGFMTSSKMNHKHKYQEFTYEYAMLKRWFDKVIVPQTAVTASK
jgi:hypothetical protein